MANVFFKAFYDLRKDMELKYGIEDIPYYVCVGINPDSPVRHIEKKEGISYYNRPINEFCEYYKELRKSLSTGFAVHFDWNGSPRQCIFARGRDGELIRAHFEDTDNYTWLTIEYDEKKNRFVVYCNFMLSEASAIERAKECMSNVEVLKIQL